MIDNMAPLRNPFLSLAVTACVLLAATSVAQQTEVVQSGDVVQLRPDHPTRYTVQKGDTLWDIANRFLQTPWHWPKIWVINEQIANPHLIYPGDVLILRFVAGRPEVTVVERPAEVAPPPEAVLPPTPEAPVAREFEGVEGAPLGRVTKLSPRVISKPLIKPIPTISPDQILPFLSRPLVVDKGELKKSGYVTIGLDDRIALGDQSEFYARGLPKGDVERYQIYRRGKAIKDRWRSLGWEAIYLGDAKMLKPGDPAKLVVTRVKEEILPADGLFVAPAPEPLPYFFPHAPEKKLEGRILTAFNSVSEIGPFTIVSVNLGREDGMEEGHVLRILYQAGKRKDPVRLGKYRLPPEEAGLMMVFRTFEEVSYGLVINATRPINIHDDVVTP